MQSGYLNKTEMDPDLLKNDTAIEQKDGK